MNYTIRTFSSPAAAGVWPTLAGLTASDNAFAFQTSDVLDVWTASIGKARRTQAFFFQIDDQLGNPLMLVPLGIESQHGTLTLAFLDAGVADYNAPIVFPAAKAIDQTAMTIIWAEMLRLLPPFDVALFEKVPVDINGVGNPFRWLMHKDDPRSGHVLELSGTWNEYAASQLPRKQDMRRKRRRLADIGKVRFVASHEPEELLATMMRQKARRYIETKGADSFDKPGYRDYFAEMTDSFKATGLLNLSALMVDDVIVATHWGIVAGSQFSFLMPSYEGGKWSAYSPGRILIEELIAWSYQQGLAVFDFGPGDEPYKSEYSSAAVALRSAKIPVSMRGRATDWLAGTSAGSLLKSARNWALGRPQRRARRG